MQLFKIGCKLDGLNEYTCECRGNKFGGGKCKRKNEDVCIAYIKASKIKPISGAYKVHFVWYEQRKTRDKDNVAFAKKFILDALQKSKITKGDDNRYLLGFTDDFVYGQGNGVIVEIYEDGE